MRALLVVIALGVAPVVAQLLPGPSDDSLRTTLSLLPALLAAVLAIEAWMRRQGLAALSSPETRWIAGLSGGLVLAALSWHSLGLGMADSLIFAGFVLLLLHWVCRALIRLPRSRG